MSERNPNANGGSGATRVLCYSPYTFWILHGLWESTILHALKFRGADVRYVLCDGLYADCDAFRAAVSPRQPLSCTQCQAQVTHLLNAMGLMYQWLGRYLKPEEFREARRWSSALSVHEFKTATYDDWTVGEWVEASVHRHFRISRLDLSASQVQEAYRNYLYSGLIACFGLSRLLDDYRPDVLFLFSGSMSSTRVALELARRRGIRVVCHERGHRWETIRLMENAPCEALQPIKEAWRDRGRIPLRRAEVETITQYMPGRARGEGLGWPAFSPPLQDLNEVREHLRLRVDRPVWVLFTSSNDELVSQRDWRGPFTEHTDWVERTIAYVGGHPEIDLVIRVHPNTAGKKAQGDNVAQMQELERLNRHLPPNVQMVMPDDPISSYSLMDLATVGLTYHSSVGLEMACKGKLVIVAAGAHVSDLPFVVTVKTADSYESILDSALNQPLMAVSADIQRMAYRFAYEWFFRWNIGFPLVSTAGHPPKLTYRSLDALLPGREPHLDRIANIILETEPISLPPTAIDRAIADTDEIAWFTNNATSPPTAMADPLQPAMLEPPEPRRPH